MKGVEDTRLLEERVMSGLKSFQRRTVDYAFDRMYESEDPTNRFLVADEVGLGKTLVARGLIARVINHLKQAGAERVDILYICSNANIASQNVRRLNVTNESEFALSTRITLLPQNLKRLHSNGLNFISFTPGTSFNMVSRTGLSQERAVIFRLIEHALDTDLSESAGAYRTLRGSQNDRNFRNQVYWVERVAEDGLDATLADAFKHEFLNHENLRLRFAQCCQNPEETGNDDWEKRASLILRLRQVLARSCISALEPDLVILDEFQRFRDLLEVPDVEDPNDIRQLSHQLFSRSETRLLLLSATPYKMYTLHDETDDNHYEDFLRVARFLMGPEEECQLRSDLDEFRAQLRRIISADFGNVFEPKLRIESRLRRFMSRTERLATSSDRNGMLTERALNHTSLTSGDLNDYRAVDTLSRELKAGDATEYWKSSPYLLNFMHNYKLKRELRRALESPERSVAIAPMLKNLNQLSASEVKGYGPVDPGNARLRGLLADTINQGTWKLPWLPPSLTYYRGNGAWDKDDLETTTKRLIFSSWNVVPDAISMLLSYEAERNMMLGQDPDAENSTEYRASHSGRLAIQSQDHDPSTMSTFALLYPGAVLAELGDPFEIAREAGAGASEISADHVLQIATRRIQHALTPIIDNADTSGRQPERWYWAAPILLDREGWAAESTVWWMMNSGVLSNPARADSEPDADHGAWSDHVALARQVIAGEIELGRPPADLAETLALLAVGSPANCALRALVRVLGRSGERRESLANTSARDAAVRIAWGFRTLFNLPGVTALLRGAESSDNTSYWRRVAATGVDGHLQAVLDEYIHVLPGWQGLITLDIASAAPKIGNEVHNSVTIRAANYHADSVTFNGNQIDLSSMNMRVRFALRFGTNVSDDGKQLIHAGAVRSAFNSPFWPFVLATTSVGQEGLDFHQYCHAVVHWNLPANPVDLEQREGRVHRYKGHAIRKNIAERNRAAAFRSSSRDPWAEMFDEAALTPTSDELRDIAPYWVYEGSARIERYVPHLPLSREVKQLERLKRSIAAYRMVIGQPRQEDLLGYLQGLLPDDELERWIEELRIDLTPGLDS